jgi:hypothetical protein
MFLLKDHALKEHKKFVSSWTLKEQSKASRRKAT